MEFVLAEHMDQVLQHALVDLSLGEEGTAQVLPREEDLDHALDDEDLETAENDQTEAEMPAVDSLTDLPGSESTEIPTNPPA